MAFENNLNTFWCIDIAAVKTKHIEMIAYVLDHNVHNISFYLSHRKIQCTQRHRHICSLSLCRCRLLHSYSSPHYIEAFLEWKDNYYYTRYCNNSKLAIVKASLPIL